MTDATAAGDILIEGGTRIPSNVPPQGKPDTNGWTTLNGARADFEKEIKEAGWTFFFMAGEIKATVFGFDKQKTQRAALKRLIANVASQHCNSIEITRVVSKSFLRLPYVTVSAHSRHLQAGNVFSRN